MTTGDFFKDSKYEKLVKSPTRTVKVWLIPAESFFNLIEEHMEEISSSFPTDTVKQELQDLLCLDSHYPDLLMMKKINKAFIKVLEENGICYKEGFQNEPTQEFSEQKPTPPVQEITKTVEEIKPRKKINNLSDLSDCARDLLLNLSIFLDSEGITVTEFLNEFTYEQLVKSSKKEATVDIISTDDFFRLIEENDKITSEKSLTEEIRQELQDLL